jgi:hypothetical protein
MRMQADFRGDFVHLLRSDRFERLAFAGELFGDLNDFLGHDFMRLFGAADEREIRAGGHAFVAIGIQTDTEQHCLGFLLSGRLRHEEKVRAAPQARQRFV